MKVVDLIHLDPYAATPKYLQLANNIIARVGEKEAAKILCDIFINNKFHPERSIKLHHFHPSKLDRGEN